MEANISEHFPTQPKYDIPTRTRHLMQRVSKPMSNTPREVNIALMSRKAAGVVLFGNGSSEKCGRGLVQNSA